MRTWRSANVARVVDAAAEQGSFVRIDMEQSSFVEATLRTYRRLRESGRENVGTVLQSYLYRSEDDLRALLELQPNLRIVKGAYLEPPELAYPRKQDVDAAYVRMTAAAMRGGAYTRSRPTTTASSRCDPFRRTERRGARAFRAPAARRRAAAAATGARARGFKVRVATPFGPEWYPYLMRRLAERPANVLFSPAACSAADATDQVRSATSRITIAEAASSTATAFATSAHTSVFDGRCTAGLGRLSLRAAPADGFVEPRRDVAVQAHALAFCSAGEPAQPGRHAKEEAPTRRRRRGTGRLIDG